MFSESFIFCFSAGDKVSFEDKRFSPFEMMFICLRNLRQNSQTIKWTYNWKVSLSDRARSSFFDIKNVACVQGIISIRLPVLMPEANSFPHIA